MILNFDPTRRQRQGASSTLAMTGISRLSRLTGASPRALRYYEEVGLLRPTRTATGGRLFSPHQCDVATAIVLMRRLDVPVSEIRSILNGARSDHERLVDLRNALETRASVLARQLNDVNLALAEWCGSGRKSDGDAAGLHGQRTGPCEDQKIGAAI